MAITEAKRLAHPPSLAVTWTFGTALRWLLSEIGALDEQTDQLVALATEQGFPQRRAQGTMYRGWLRVRNGDVADGMSRLRRGLADYRATRA